MAIKRFTSVLLTFWIFCAIMLGTINVDAAYSLSITGEGYFQGAPLQPQNFSGHVRITLNSEAQSSLSISINATGDIAKWINWTDPITFRIYPGQSIVAHYILEVPNIGVGEYTGMISAVGLPPVTETSGSTIVPGAIGVSIGVLLEIRSGVYFQMIDCDENRAYSSIVNTQEIPFSGVVTYNLTHGGIWDETLNETIINLQTNYSSNSVVTWNVVPKIGVLYSVSFQLLNLTGTIIDEKFQSFRIPTPAEIENLWHQQNEKIPNTIVYEDTDAYVYATVHDSQAGSTLCRLHYIVDGGFENNVSMRYDNVYDYYEYCIDNSSFNVGSLVEYWVTSSNDVSGNIYTDISEIKAFKVYSSTASDLTINSESIFFSPIDPLNNTMNQTDVTNIFITVRNIGRGTASNALVRVYDHEVPIWNTTITTIAGQGGLNTVRFTWSPTEGEHILRFEVDPDNAIIELNENNNHYTMAAATVGPTPPAPPPEETETPMNIVPYIIIPIILAMLIILLLRRKKTINVTVSEVKPFKHPKDGSMRWIYTCTYGKSHELGVTKSTDIQAVQGAVIKVKPSGIIEEADGTLAWLDAVVVEVAEEADSEAKIRKLAKRKKE